ncbi:sensor histidine kinase [Cohnella silvisoli]|uniref:histidine kinase n=1 Tax=Cohnella silvisoli TaxID=2873699 RepID=A0ABV1KXL9_9BACL|nr:sensor histidine kinase [Cohnella silvisoli]MCD9023863.1 sensor histidine kinase [Cohnella silvisoli]
MKRTSIRLRLMLLMICLTTLPVITVTWIATNNTRDSVEKEIINANESRMLWANQYLDELIQQIDILFYTLQINEPLMTGLNDSESTDVGVQFKTQNYISSTLKSAFYANSRKIDLLTLYSHLSQKAFSVNYVSSGIVSSLDISGGVWSRMRQTPLNMYFKQSGKGIYAFHGIYRFPDQKLLGGLSVRINRDVWEEVARILKSEPESSVFLLNDEGEMLSGSTESGYSQEIQSQIESLNIGNSELQFTSTGNYFYFMKKVNDGSLTVVKAVPSGTVAKSANATIKAGIVTGSLFAAASVLLSILVSLRISRPIVSLAKTMRNVHIHNFEIKSVQSHDEIGLLERGYNSMMQRIKELIEDEYQREIDVKNAQLSALQAQINPHFLNNTLHLIGGMALTKDAPEIYKITQVIGELLRYSISTDGDKVPLEFEIKHMRNYLFIQENRFIGRCNAIISINEDALEGMLPKFTLQPIVENAFEHGLQRKEGAWTIEVRVKRIGNHIAILIKDEGVGFTKERLEQLRMELLSGLSSKVDKSEQDEPRRRKGIGLKNVDARLKLHFGAKYGLRIVSNAGQGTIVIIKLPVSDRGA